MDALEFIRERNRMCCTFDKSCDGCPAYENGWECDNDTWDERIVATVEQWSKEHPHKTRQSVFLEQYPEARIGDDGMLQINPCSISASHRNARGNCATMQRECSDCRREFWGQKAE